MKMVEVKTAELIGSALDWAVAKADGRDMGLFIPVDGRVQICGMWSSGCTFRPSTDWSQGGPLIEKYDVTIFRIDGETVGAEFDHSYIEYESQTIDAAGQTYLVAACRAIVAAKLGEVVSVPAELVTG